MKNSSDVTNLDRYEMGRHLVLLSYVPSQSIMGDLCCIELRAHSDGHCV